MIILYKDPNGDGMSDTVSSSQKVISEQETTINKMKEERND